MILIFSILFFKKMSSALNTNFQKLQFYFLMCSLDKYKLYDIKLKLVNKKYRIEGTIILIFK